MSILYKLSSKKILVAAFCFAYFFIYHLNLSSGGNESLRSSVRGVDESKKLNRLEEDKISYKPRINKIERGDIEIATSRAMADMTNTAQEEFTMSKSWLHNAIEKAQISVYRTMNTYIQEENIPKETVEKMYKDISKKIENELQEDFVKKVNEAINEAKKKLNDIVDEDVGVNLNENSIKDDIKDVRDYYVKTLKENIDELEIDIESKIRSVSQNIEKDVLKTNLGRSVDNEELDSKEVSSVVLEKEDEVFEKANEEANALSDDITAIEGRLERSIKKVLQEFLVKEKKLSSEEAKEVEETVSEQLRDVEERILDEKIQGLEDLANKDMNNLEEIAEEDFLIVEEAKKLGMSEDNNSAISKIENNLDDLSLQLEKTFKSITAASKNMIIDSLQKATKNIERSVFEDKGISISDEELTRLVKEATKGIRSSGKNMQ